MQSRVSAAIFTVLAFGALLAVASPVPEASTEVVEVKRAAGLVAILNIFLDLQIKIKALLVVIAGLNGKGSCAGPVGQIVVLINACITAIINVGVVVDISDTVTLNAIVSIVADLILQIQAHITVFASILVNVIAVVNLDICLQALLLNLNICITGIVTLIAPLCINLTVVANLGLSLVVGILGLL